MAGRLAFEPITVRTHSSESHGPRLRNYRPVFESIVLGRSSGNLDPEMVRSLESIIGAAYRKGDEKGVGGQVREIFADFALNIDNNIVKLASQRIGEVVRGVSAEHLPEFLTAMHREMLKSPERADAIPEAMLGAYRMSGGRLGADSIVRAVRIGFAKSRTACPKEVSNAVKSEYESGGLDHIADVAAIRNGQGPQAIEVSYALPAQPAANDGMPVPEALPIAHFIAPKMPEEPSQAASCVQEVPQIVASRQREEIRERRNFSQPDESRAAENAKSAAAADARAGAPPVPPAALSPARSGQGAAKIEPRKDERPRAGAGASREAPGRESKIPEPDARTAPIKAKARTIVMRAAAPASAKASVQLNIDAARLPKTPEARRTLQGPAKARPRANALPEKEGMRARGRNGKKEIRAKRESPVLRLRAEPAKKRNRQPTANARSAAAPRKKNEKVSSKRPKDAAGQKPASARRERRPAIEVAPRRQGRRKARAPGEGRELPGARHKVKNAPKAKTDGFMRRSYRVRRDTNRSRGVPQAVPARQMITRIISRIMDKSRRKPGEIIFKLGF